MPYRDFNKVEIALRHWCSPVNFLHIFRTHFQQNTSMNGCFCNFTKIFTCQTHNNFRIVNLLQLLDIGQNMEKSLSSFRISSQILFIPYMSSISSQIPYIRNLS